MPNNWKKYKLEDVLHIKNGKTKPKHIGEFPIYGGNGILGFGNKTNLDGESILIGRVGAYCGSVYFENRSIWVSDNSLFGKAKSGFDSKYLFYLLKWANLNRYSIGSSQPLLTQGALNILEFHIPSSIKEQKAIASILSALDDKIENNLAMNKTLEDMAMALYKHWFVDFGPFADGEFVNSELGLIPKGWEVSTIGHHYNSERGLSYKGKFLSEEGVGVPMHNLNSVFEGGYYKHKGLKWYTGEYKDRHIVRPGDLIVTNTEQGFEYKLIGSTALIPKRYGDFGIFSHHLYKISAKKHSHLTNQYLYYRLLDKNYRFYVTAYANGTTVNMLAKEGLIMPKIIIPTKNVISEFSALVASKQEMCERNLDENQTLTQLRDTLLPNLISGEVRLKEFQETLANVL